MPMSTCVQNFTREVITCTLKQGSAGVFTEENVIELVPSAYHWLDDAGENFLEQICVVNGPNYEVRFTSDDFIKFHRIGIRYNGENGYTWKGVRRPGEQIDVHLSDVDELGEEIETLFALTNSGHINAAVQNFERREEYFGVQVERKLTRKAEVNTDIFNIVGFFSVYQGVVLTAVSQLKSDSYSTCGVLPFPIILSCLGALVGIAALSSKFVSLRELEHEISVDQNSLRDVIRKSEALRRRAIERDVYTSPDRSVALDVKEGNYETTRCTRCARGLTLCLRESLPFLSRERSFRGTSVILAMFLFTAVFILSYFAILCDGLVIRKWKGGFGSTSSPSST